MLALGPDLFGTRWLALGPLRYDNLYPLILVLTGADFFEALLLTFFLDEHRPQRCIWTIEVKSFPAEKGSEHCIINTDDNVLCLLTVFVER